MREFFEKNNYPANKEYILKNSLRRVSDWIFYEKEALEVKFRNLRDNEEFRSMLPFAGTKDERLIASFCENSDNRVYVIDTSDKVWFIVNEYGNIYCWIRNILREYVINNILQKKESSKTLREIGELFYY